MFKALLRDILKRLPLFPALWFLDRESNAVARGRIKNRRLRDVRGDQLSFFSPIKFVRGRERLPLPIDSPVQCRKLRRKMFR